MNSDRRKQKPIPQRRRYIVHLSSMLEVDGEDYRYVVRIRPAATPATWHFESCERVFKDDFQLIAVVNPLLPPGSDVRDVFGHIESPDGFFYLLWLSNEESRQLGWIH